MGGGWGCVDVIGRMIGSLVPEERPECGGFCFVVEREMVLSCGFLVALCVLLWIVLEFPPGCRL